MTETRRGFIAKTIAFLATPFVAKKAACDHNIQRYFSGPKEWRCHACGVVMRP